MSADRSDREQIHDVLVRYATGIDTKSWPLFRTCFTADVHADYGDTGVWDGVDAITEYMTGAHEHMIATQHMMSNFVIDVDGDTASAASYVHVVLTLTEDPLRWVEAVGHYADELVRAADGWRICNRTYSMTRLLASEGVLG
ncbi:MAG: nuclear transport factor 2 family protein [Acidimicrobiia bacterium]